MVAYNFNLSIWKGQELDLCEFKDSLCRKSLSQKEVGKKFIK